MCKILKSFHFFQVDGYPLYSMATPTIAGAKETLAYLGAEPTLKGSIVERVITTDLREEAVVYINGTPFVLRELNKPVDTLKHVGITGPAVCHHNILVSILITPSSWTSSLILFLFKL